MSNENDTQKSKVITPSLLIVRAQKTIGASVSNEMSCEIYDNAKLLMQNRTERFSCCYSRASNLRQAVTKIPLCRMICMKMFWFSVITSLPPVHGAIACWDSAPFFSTSPAMIASVAVKEGGPSTFGYAANASLCAGRRLHHPLKLSYLHNEYYQ